MICSRDNMTFVAICDLHRIVGTILTTENSVHNREQYIEFSFGRALSLDLAVFAGASHWRADLALKFL